MGIRYFAYGGGKEGVACVSIAGREVFDEDVAFLFSTKNPPEEVTEEEYLRYKRRRAWQRNKENTKEEMSLEEQYTYQSEFIQTEIDKTTHQLLDSEFQLEFLQELDRKGVTFGSETYRKMLQENVVVVTDAVSYAKEYLAFLIKKKQALKKEEAQNHHE